jgi:predicted XRE-type DNA-binding protein
MKKQRHRNEYFAMGLPADESAVDLAIKAELGVAIARFLLEKDISQTEAAKRYDIQQPVVSKIMSGNLEKLSLSFLWRLLFRMGQRVRAQTGLHPDETIVTVGDVAPVSLSGSLFLVQDQSHFASSGTATVRAAPRRAGLELTSRAATDA